MSAPSFKEWFGSTANPLYNASNTAQFFAADALKAAFEAGEARERDQWRVKREKQTDDFTF